MERGHCADERVERRVEDQIPRGGGGDHEGRVGEELEEGLAEHEGADDGPGVGVEEEDSVTAGVSSDGFGGF